MLILRTIVDEEQQSGRRYAVDEAVKQGLGPGVDPLQILNDQEERLYLTVPEQQALDRIDGP